MENEENCTYILIRTILFVCHYNIKILLDNSGFFFFPFFSLQLLSYNGSNITNVS